MPASGVEAQAPGHPAGPAGPAPSPTREAVVRLGAGAPRTPSAIQRRHGPGSGRTPRPRGGRARLLSAIAALALAFFFALGHSSLAPRRPPPPTPLASPRAEPPADPDPATIQRQAEVVALAGDRYAELLLLHRKDETHSVPYISLLDDEVLATWRQLVAAQARWTSLTRGEAGLPEHAFWTTSTLLRISDLHDVLEDGIRSNFLKTRASPGALRDRLPRYFEASELAFAPLVVDGRAWPLAVGAQVETWLLLSQGADPQGVVERLRRRLGPQLAPGASAEVEVALQVLAKAYNELHDQETIPCPTHSELSTWLLDALLRVRPSSTPGGYDAHAPAIGRALESVVIVHVRECPQLATVNHRELLERAVAWVHRLEDPAAAAPPREGPHRNGLRDVLEDIRPFASAPPPYGPTLRGLPPPVARPAAP